MLCAVYKSPKKQQTYLFIKQREKDPVILLIYVNNSAIIEKKKNIDKIIKNMKKTQ